VQDILYLNLFLQNSQSPQKSLYGLQPALSPGLNVVTLDPTFSTTPTTSWPGHAGSSHGPHF